MEKRMLLAVVLSFLAVTLYSAVTGRGCMAPPPPPSPSPTGEEGPQGTPPPAEAPGGNGAAAPPAAPVPGGPPVPEPPADLSQHPQRSAPVLRHVLRSEELEVGFTSQGGAVEFVRQRHAFESDGETPFDQVLPVDPALLLGAIDDQQLMPEAPGGATRREPAPGPLRNPELPWTRDEAAEAATGEDDVIFTFETGTGLRFRKQWFLGQGERRFDLRLRLSVEALAEGQPVAVDVKLLAASGQLRERVQGAFAQPNGVVYQLDRSRDVSDLQPWGLAYQEIKTSGLDRARLKLFGSRSAYFMTLLYAPTPEQAPPVVGFWATGEDARGDRGPLEEHLRDFYLGQRGKDVAADPALAARIVEGVLQLHHCWATLRLPVQSGGQPVELAFYVGPVERAAVRQDGYETLRGVVTYPNAADFVADVLLAIYDFWRNLFGSAGLAVILMTLCVRGALMPLSVRNQLSMRKYGRKVAKLKPKVQALQQRYANNPKRLREEQMKLYREHGVGFPTGCLMMLIQIPIFFALFSSLRVEYTIRGASFLWIKDLSGPDRLIDFGHRLFDIGILYVDSINILPLLMVGLSILHTRNMPQPADEQQAQQMKMMKWLPIVFAVILYNYTAALALYMVLSSAVAILESKIVKARDEEGEAPAPATA